MEEVKKVEDKKKEENSNNSILFMITLTAYLIGIPVMFLIGSFAKQELVSIPLLWTFAGALYIIFSFRWTQLVQAGFIGIRSRFGRAVGQVGEGLVFAPLFIYSLQLLDLKFNQNELPAEPKDIWEGDMDKITDDKIPPVRVPFRDSITMDQAKQAFGEQIEVVNKQGQKIHFITEIPEDGLARRVTAQVTPIIQWQIKNGLEFVRTIKSEKEVIRQLEDEIFRIINMQLPKMSYGQALQNLGWINVQILEAATYRAEGWGIDLKAAYIKSMPLHHGLNTAIGELSEAEFKGRAERELTIKRGEGVAQAASDLEEKTLAGRGAGLKAAAEATGLTPAELQGAEVARAIGEGGNAVIIGGDGFGQLAGLAAATLAKGNKSTPKKEE